MTTRVTMTIEGMECPNCAMRLEGIEDKLKGVLRAEASYRKGQMVVEFDGSKVTEEQIKAEVSRLGYQVTEVAASK